MKWNLVREGRHKVRSSFFALVCGTVLGDRIVNLRSKRKAGIITEMVFCLRRGGIVCARGQGVGRVLRQGWFGVAPPPEAPRVMTLF